MWFLKEYLGIGRIKNSVLFNAENNDTEKIEELKNIIRENTSQSEEYIENQIKTLLPFLTHFHYQIPIRKAYSKDFGYSGEWRRGSYDKYFYKICDDL